MIDEIMEPVVVPWRAGRDDHDAEVGADRIAGMDRPLARDLRRLQQYTVPIPPRAREAWLAAGVLRPVHPALGDALLRFDNLDYYDPQIGSSSIRVSDRRRRTSSHRQLIAIHCSSRAFTRRDGTA